MIGIAFSPVLETSVVLFVHTTLPSLQNGRKLSYFDNVLQCQTISVTVFVPSGFFIQYINCYWSYLTSETLVMPYSYRYKDWLK